MGTDLAELSVYPGERHLFADSSLPSCEPGAAELVLRRSRALLDRIA